MKGIQLRLYTCENRRHGGLPTYEWLLEQARKQGIPGGSAFRAIAGYGRHGRLHEQAFFELAGEEPVVIEFIAGDEQAERFLQLLHAELPDLFVVRVPVEYGHAGDGSEVAGQG
jgi:PII-like signaling protein